MGARTIGLLALALALLSAAGAPPGSAPATAQTPEPEARISARRLADGRIEFALQQRAASGWGERILPSRRFFPATGGSGWLHSSPVTAAGAEARISARRLADGRVEFALQRRDASEWGERELPRQRFFPATGGEQWLNSSPVALGEAANSLAGAGQPPSNSPPDVAEESEGNESFPMRLTDAAGADGSPAWSPDGRRIAFHSDRDGDWDIYVMNANGSGVRRLTDDSDADVLPSWSPDGRRVAFSSDRDGDWEIFVMNADGSNMRRLTDAPGVDVSPVWSPDGRRIAFSSDRDGDREIFVMNADGTMVMRLTDHPDADTQPSWSPDGRRIAFVSNRDGDAEVYLMNSDGSNVRRLTNTAVSDQQPAWSPDGQRIAFASTRDGDDTETSDGDREIYVMNADGSDVRRLTDNTDWDNSPAWSPDGLRMTFASNRDGDSEIYVTSTEALADSSFTKLITDIPGTGLTWSPDGRIAFASGRNNIYVMKADGSDVRRLTADPGADDSPAWSPDGRLIAFARAHEFNSSERDIYVMNTDGSDVRRLTDSGEDVSGLAWSLDGRKIAFTRYAFGQDMPQSARCPARGKEGNVMVPFALYVMNVDGTNVRFLDFSLKQFRGGEFSGERPLWSPDGRITFSSNRDGCDGTEIYVMNADGSGVIRLTNDFGHDSEPAWSPDGRRIAFSSDRDGDWDIYVMNADGSDVRRLTDNSDADSQPAWSPDGQRIAFVSDRDGDGEIYVMNADGTEVRRLTDNSAWDGNPVWSPDGRLIASARYRTFDAAGAFAPGRVYDIYAIEP